MASNYACSPSCTSMAASLSTTTYASIFAYYPMNVYNTTSNKESLSSPCSVDATSPEVIAYPTLIGVGDVGGTNGHATTSVVPANIDGVAIGAIVGAIVGIIATTIGASVIIGTIGGGGDACSIPPITTYSLYGVHHIVY